MRSYTSGTLSQLLNVLLNSFHLDSYFLGVGVCEGEKLSQQKPFISLILSCDSTITYTIIKEAFLYCIISNSTYCGLAHGSDDNIDHRHLHGFLQQYRLWTSTQPSEWITDTIMDLFSSNGQFFSRTIVVFNFENKVMKDYVNPIQRYRHSS